jgi:Ca2+-binding EF-hand superfamily protein
MWEGVKMVKHHQHTTTTTTTTKRKRRRRRRRSTNATTTTIIVVYGVAFLVCATLLFLCGRAEARRAFFSRRANPDGVEDGKAPKSSSSSSSSFGGDVDDTYHHHHDDDDGGEDWDPHHNRWEEDYPDDFDADYHDYDRYHDFNVTKRLEEIFPLIDIDGDGIVSKDELRIWHYTQARNNSENRAEHEFDVTDNDHDGYVTLKEYLEDDFDIDVTGNGTEKEMEEYNVRWIRNARKVFELTDTDKDGKLNRTEFFYFIHPEEGKHGSEIGKHLVAETIRDHDMNMDEKLNFTEFFESLFHQVDEVEDEESNSNDDGNSRNNNNDAYEENVMRVRALALFARLDKDKDGLVTSRELHADEATYKKLHPTNDDHARDQSASLMVDADENKDGGLSLVEILKNKMMFYSTAMTSEDDYYDYHDEF